MTEQKAKKVRFRNKSDGLQVVYNEDGEKRELVPNATIFFDPAWGSRYRCLEQVVQTVGKPKAVKASDDSETAETE